MRLTEPGVLSRETHKLLFIDLVLPSAVRLDKLDFAALNKSLLSLLKCITTLNKSTKDAYIPFRDSLLTKLLRDHILHSEGTACLGSIDLAAPIDDNIKCLDFLAKLSQLRVKRLSSAQVEHNLTPVQYKQLIVGLEDEKLRLAQLADEKTIHEQQPCNCESLLAIERTKLIEDNSNIRVILAERLNYAKSANEARYVAELAAHDLSERRQFFMEQTLNESGHFVERGGSIEQYINQQDAKFKKECSALEQAIARNYESQ